MLYKKIYCVLLLLTVQSAHAQIDSILSLPGSDLQLKGFFDWSVKNIYWDGQIDRDKKLALMKEASGKFGKTGNEKLIRECWFFTQLLNTGGAMKQPLHWEESANNMLTAAREANQKGWLYTEAECRMVASAMYFNKNHYREGIEQTQRAHDIFQQEGIDKYPEASFYIADIANWYNDFGDYETAIRYFNEALSVRPPWNQIPRLQNILNTLAICYKNVENYDSSIYYFQKAHDEAVKTNNEFWQGLIEGNMAQVYILTGEVDKALPLSLNDFATSKANHQMGSAANAANDLATIYIKKGDLATAKNYLAYALQNLDTSYSKGRIKIYDNLSQLNLLNKDYFHAYMYLDSFVYFSQKLAKQKDAKIIDRTKLMLELEKYSSELKLIESEKKSQKLIRNVMIAGIILICILAILVISRIKSRKNMAIKAAALEKRFITEELEHSKKELDSFTNLLKEKNEMIETFKNSIDKIKSDDAGTGRDATISQLTQANILTEDDWKQFRVLFDKAYPGFFIRLREKMPDLSAADTRMMALIKLQITQKEMAAMLGIGYDAIRKARQRLREKINLEKNSSIEELVNMI